MCVDPGMPECPEGFDQYERTNGYGSVEVGCWGDRGNAVGDMVSHAADGRLGGYRIADEEFLCYPGGRAAVHHVRGIDGQGCWAEDGSVAKCPDAYTALRSAWGFD